MNTHTASLPHTAEAAREARTQIAHLLDRRCSLLGIDTAVLLTSELVTNAVLHASPPVHLRAVVSDSFIRVEIHDSSNSTLPRPRKTQPSDHDGRGLTIIEALASRWGTEQTNGGKSVWFQLSYDHDVGDDDFEERRQGPAVSSGN